jgi:predicted Zn-dependent protease
VATSEELARLAPEDAEYMGQLGSEHSRPAVSSWFDATATLDSGGRLEAIQAVTARARARGLISTGFVPAERGSRAVATSRGLFSYTRSSSAAFSTTVRTQDGTGSGWAGTGILDWSQVDFTELAERAVAKAEASRDPQPIDPGRWTVILEPQAVGSLAGFIFGALQARAADEGRSFFTRPGGGTRIGERLLDARVSLVSDPDDPRLFSAPFSGEGLPNRRMVWFDSGVLQNLVYDRYWAQQQKVEPTGFSGGSFVMSGGDTTIDRMIAGTERGLLVTRFWYMRAVDPRTILYTGLTRDGTFLIEDGRIVRPVQNLRWNESPMHVLNSIESMGPVERILPSESGSVGPAVLVPAVKVRDFNFTSVSDAV